MCAGLNSSHFLQVRCNRITYR